MEMIAKGAEKKPAPQWNRRLMVRMIDSRSVGDQRLCIAPSGCEESILRGVRRNTVSDDEENGIDVARMLGFKRACRSINGLVSERMDAVVSEG